MLTTPHRASASTSPPPRHRGRRSSSTVPAIAPQPTLHCCLSAVLTWSGRAILAVYHRKRCTQAALRSRPRVRSTSPSAPPRCRAPKRAPTPVTNWTEAYAECRARQKSATACVPLLDLCRKYQRVHHALLVAPPLRLDPHVMSTLRTLAATFGSETRAAAAISAQPGGVVNPCGELAPVCLRCADFAEISLAWSGTIWSGPHSATGLPPAPLDAALAGSGTCATTAAEQGPGAATPPPPPPPVSNVTSHHRSRASAPTARRHVGATQTPKSAPAVVGRRTRVPTVVVGGSSTD